MHDKIMSSFLGFKGLGIHRHAHQPYKKPI